jgi:hypothetical protein
MNTRENHHYVPRHFLAAWATDSDGKKINRYIRIRYPKEIKFKKNVGIRSAASRDDIYVVTDGTDSAEFETIIMTKELDTPTATILKKLRQNGLPSLGVSTGVSTPSSELLDFARYVVALETRHPKTIAQMGVSPDDVTDIGNKMSKNINSPSVKAVSEFVSKLDIGTYVAGLQISNDDTFARNLLSSCVIELTFGNSLLYTFRLPHRARWSLR